MGRWEHSWREASKLETGLFSAAPEFSSQRMPVLGRVTSQASEQGYQGLTVFWCSL